MVIGASGRPVDDLDTCPFLILYDETGVIQYFRLIALHDRRVSMEVNLPQCFLRA